MAFVVFSSLPSSPPHRAAGLASVSTELDEASAERGGPPSTAARTCAPALRPFDGAQDKFPSGQAALEATLTVAQIHRIMGVMSVEVRAAPVHQTSDEFWSELTCLVSV